MSILTEIISWSSEIPGWQGDAVRRILEKGLLEEADKKEIVAMFKKEFGLIEDKDVNIPSPNLLKLREEKELSDEKVLVTLKSMGHLQNVNALDSDQKLEFGDTGVTVVFGENASGKSGYARVLKKACRARGYVDNILPNVYQDSSKEETASAIFNLSINGENKEIKWSDKDENPDDMTYIAVFDSKSERFYVDDKNTITYIPYGLDVFDKLAYLCDYLRDKLQDDLVEVDEFPEELENIPKIQK